MRLKHIKLSGFKSFVDTTKISVTNNLIGIVGPNGCGKSNVIDAIRWVMGESSAKMLRGDSMDDVIFNGSASRKPVNKATVELVFDNKDGSAPGAYAKFAEIAIRRELSRENGSKYFINKVKCRRKDIQDIFLGTGLGPRSYSIIEQGMVGRIVESKPEELRNLIEEAAGISKYKERRRETENRIRHTRDNLSRVEDIVGELETQLRRLKRQASEAERYKTLKQQQRELDAQLKTLKWSTLHDKVKSKDLELERVQTEFDSNVAEQRDVESQIEIMREQQVELTEVLNKVQAEYYSIGGEISNVEQNITHVKQSRQQQQEEFDRLKKSELEASQHLKLDQQRLIEVSEQKEQLTPLLEELNEKYDCGLELFQQANSEYQTWQQEWELLNTEAANPEKERDVQAARIEQHDQQIVHFTQRGTSLAAGLLEIDSNINIDDINELKLSVETIDEECVLLEEALQTQDQQIVSQRQKLEESRESYNNVRHELQDKSARLSSLNAIQAAALGEDNKKLNTWLEQRGLSKNKRLASLLSVKTGWETAVDTVLGDYVNAISVDVLESFEQEMTQANNGRVLFVDGNAQVSSQSSNKFKLLQDQVSAKDVAIDGLFYGVYVASSVSDALSKRKQLAVHESFITKEGCWIGLNWASFGADSDTQGGVLQRTAEIDEVGERVEELTTKLKSIQMTGEQARELIQQHESEREEKRKDFRNKSHTRSDLHNQLSRIEARSAELISQREKIIIEQQEVSDQLFRFQDELSTAKRLLLSADEQAIGFVAKREVLVNSKDSLTSQLESSRQQEQSLRDQRQAKQIEYERLSNSDVSLNESINRLSQQLESQLKRVEELYAALSDNEDPTLELQSQLQTLLESRLSVEQGLTKARNDLAQFENQMKSADRTRLGFDQKAKSVRDGLESTRMSRQELTVRRDTISEQLDKDTEQMLLMCQGLSDELDLASVERDLASVIGKVERIGAVNLMAIDEYEQCSERKVYLDSQSADLNEAMATLEDAINKIDKETRTRFKETFELLNVGFKEFFPKLFGGGSAYLELTGSDLLDTGVSVMARPPGKRNSTIHLLSGGEKALTAVSLLFSFFELNPAPFCVLDEVDAPLDDANVERYAKVLQQLGTKTQLLFITHNKITMEVSDILVGVTMAEAGVSRLVTVNIEEAASMALE